MAADWDMYPVDEDDPGIIESLDEIDSRRINEPLSLGKGLITCVLLGVGGYFGGKYAWDKKATDLANYFTDKSELSDSLNKVVNNISSESAGFFVGGGLVALVILGMVYERLKK